jgi:hypothetical protein
MLNSSLESSLRQMDYLKNDYQNRKWVSNNDLF